MKKRFSALWNGVKIGKDMIVFGAILPFWAFFRPETIVDVGEGTYNIIFSRKRGGAK